MLGFNRGPEFDVDGFLAARTAPEDFLLVEIGHGPHPIVFNQASKYVGQAAYIGVEKWLRDRYAVKDDLIRAQLHPSLNAFFMELGMWADPTTHLSDGVADEVFLGDVFSDPIIGNKGGGDKPEAILGESARLLKPTGTIVIRNTETPDHASVNKKMIKAAGLDLLGLLKKTKTSPREWAQLEQFYDANPMGMRAEKKSFYMFLGKTAE